MIPRGRDSFELFGEGYLVIARWLVAVPFQRWTGLPQLPRILLSLHVHYVHTKITAQYLTTILVLRSIVNTNEKL